MANREAVHQPIRHVERAVADGARATRSRRGFDRLMAVLRTVNRMLPRFVRRFPFNVLLADVDRRIRTERPLV